MSLSRPDLSGIAPELLAYIEALESALKAALEAAQSSSSPRSYRADAEPDPSEPPTTRNVITISRSGMAKRTPRHHYTRQRRGGMGVFDLDSGEDDPPAFLAEADEGQGLILLTDQGRAFRLRVGDLEESPVRAKGVSLPQRLGFRADERLAGVQADGDGTHLILVTERGQVRRFAAHLVGPALRPGTALYDPRDGGSVAALCWSKGAADLFIATRQGKAIRFSERQVPVRGCLGIRLDRDDAVCGVAAVDEESGVFLIEPEGKGTIRQMGGFSANKSPGSGGKTAMKTDILITAVGVKPNQDVFVISRLGKIIRFPTEEVPPKEGVVQGVNCMSLRADEVVAVAVTG